MSLFLNIVFACLIAIGIAVLIGIGFIFFYFRKICAAGSGAEPTPFSLHLHEDLHPDWLALKDAAMLIEQLHKNGFTPGKAYVIDEMENVKLHSYFDGKYAAVVYQVENMGHFFDLFHKSENEEILAVSTMPFAGDLETPPNKVILGYKTLSVSEALSIMNDKCSQLAPKNLDNNNFREVLEQDYKEEQAYRNRNGGIKFEEFKKIASNQKLKDEKLREAFLEHKTEELMRWNYACVDEYLEQHAPENNGHYESAHCFLVPDKSYAPALVHFLNDQGIINENQVEHYAKAVNDDTHSLALFAQINQSRSPELRATEKAEMTFPVNGKIYQIAENDSY